MRYSMITRNLTAAAAATIAMTIATSAGAEKVAYTVTGSFGGSVDGTTFAGQRLTFRGVGDTGDAQDIFDEIHQPLNSLSIVGLGARYDVTEATTFFLSPGASFAGIVDGDGATGLLRFAYDPANPMTAAPVTFFTDALTRGFATSGGAFLIATGSDMSFSVGGAVPEPATWAAMVIGFAVAGSALRRKRPRSVGATPDPA